MNLKNILRNMTNYFRENLGLITAIVVTAVILIVVIIASSALLEKNSTHVSAKNKTTHSTLSNEKEETDTSLSDLEFTLPEDITEETETTLPAGDYSYLIKVNRVANCVTVHRQDENGEFTIPYKAMACSVGKNIENTPLGSFKTSQKYTWRLMVDDTYSQYATRIYGGILFHSIPCFTPNSGDMEGEEFNKLGSNASLGCVRLTVADAKWIYDNCAYGTQVIIYDDKENPGPLGKPSVIKIPSDSLYKGWDPTDPDPNNPWNTCEPSIEGVDITAPVGSKLDLLSTIKATDTCGNDITSSVKITGTVDFKQSGTYHVRYSVTDLLNRSASLDVIVKVVKSSSSKITMSEKKYSPSSGTMPATVEFPNEYGKKDVHYDNTTQPYIPPTEEQTTEPMTTEPPTTTEPLTTPVPETPAPETTTVPPTTPAPTTTEPAPTTTQPEIITTEPETVAPTEQPTTVPIPQDTTIPVI